MKKIIIWGYPLHSHTHSYIHYGWFKAFKHLGYETHWFYDDDYPSNFDYTNCIFITEGYADKNIPMHPSNIYCVHVAKNPYKYLEIGARFIDIRYNVTDIKDCNYNYSLKDKNLQTISTVTLYEKEASDRDLHPQFQHREKLTYEAIYMCWATDLLPHEINFGDRYIAPEEPPVSYFLGSIGDGNKAEINKFIQACEDNQIKVVLNDPWKNPLNFENAKVLVQKSIIAPDIRGSGDQNKPDETGTHHKRIGYIPCRLFKNISYGKLGAANCKRLHDLFGDIVCYHDDETSLVKKCLELKNDKEYILKQMEWVKDNHTYINRITDLLYVINSRK